MLLELVRDLFSRRIEPLGDRTRVHDVVHQRIRVTGENFRLFSSLEIPFGEGLSGWVAENRKAILNGNPSVESGYLDDPTKFVSCAQTEDNALYVYYFPAGATGSVRLHINDPKAVKWFNPRTGKWDDKKPKGLFAPPDEEDWLMVVKP